MNKAKNVICIIGPKKPPIGGISISYDEGCTYLKTLKHRFELLEVDTNQFKRFRGLSEIIKMVKYFFRAEISILYLATTALPSLGLTCLILAKLTKTKIVIRKGGGLDAGSLGRIRGAISWKVLRLCDMYLAQTQRLFNEAKKQGLSNAVWFPTTRSRVIIPNKRNSENKKLKCMFAGHIKETKGVGVLIDCFRELQGEPCCIDLYGPLHQKDLIETLPENGRYIGVKTTEEIRLLMADYDVLILATYHPGEGYHGVIIEAMMSGLAIISTNWLDIPEVAMKECSILISPRSTTELKKAVRELMFNRARLKMMQNNALYVSRVFETGYWYEKLLEQLTP